MTNAGQVIDRYELGGRLLATAVAGLSEEQAKSRVLPGAWSIAEIVAHMVDSDLVGIERMKRVIAEDNPILRAYDQDRWMERLDPNSMPVEDGVALFAANRAWMAKILRKCSESDWGRVGQHSEDGEKSLAKLLVGYVNHLDSHLRFLYGKRGTLGVMIIPRYSQD